MVRIVKNGDRIQGFIFLDRIAFFSDTRPMSYPGGKGGSGVYQRIISMMPPHKIYIEAFLGNGTILRYKKPAERNIGIEIDSEVLKLWSDYKDIEIINEDAIGILKTFNQKLFTPETLIYCDPPYLQNVRASKAPIYKFEMLDETTHLNFLIACRNLSKATQTKIMISGYDSKLYNRYLPAIEELKKHHETSL